MEATTPRYEIGTKLYRYEPSFNDLEVWEDEKEKGLRDLYLNIDSDEEYNKHKTESNDISSRTEV